MNTVFDLSYTVTAISDIFAVTAHDALSTLAVSLSKGAGKFPLLSVVPSDVVGRVFTGARAISESSVSSMSDSVIRAFTGFRSTSQNLASAIAASVRKDVGKFPDRKSVV